MKDTDGSREGSADLDGDKLGSLDLDGCNDGSADVDGVKLGSLDLDGVKLGSLDLDGCSDGTSVGIDGVNNRASMATRRRKGDLMVNIVACVAFTVTVAVVVVADRLLFSV